MVLPMRAITLRQPNWWSFMQPKKPSTMTNGPDSLTARSRLNNSSDFLNPWGSLYLGVSSPGSPGKRPAYATTSPLALWMGMAMRSAIMPLEQKPMPKSTMVSGIRPRCSTRYGCWRSSLSRRNFRGALGVLLSGDAFGDAAGRLTGLDAGTDAFGSAVSALSSLADMASGSRLNHSIALSAAAWMLTFSISAMKSRTLPPCLHSLKQFQMFLMRLTRNCVGLLPLWMGHGPLRLSVPRLNFSSRP